MIDPGGTVGHGVVWPLDRSRHEETGLIRVERLLRRGGCGWAYLDEIKHQQRYFLVETICENSYYRQTAHPECPKRNHSGPIPTGKTPRFQRGRIGSNDPSSRQLGTAQSHAGRAVRHRGEMWTQRMMVVGDEARSRYCTNPSLTTFFLKINNGAYFCAKRGAKKGENGSGGCPDGPTQHWCHLLGPFQQKIAVELVFC